MSLPPSSMLSPPIPSLKLYSGNGRLEGQTDCVHAGMKWLSPIAMVVEPRRQKRRLCMAIVAVRRRDGACARPERWRRNPEARGVEAAVGLGLVGAPHSPA
eukprot:1527932-Prymnesium_polylepis.1